MMRLLGRLLRQVSWPELRHHPWRHLAALLAVVLGVALAFSVQLINQSALSEFSAAARAVGGVPDFELRGPLGGFDEALYGRVARDPQVAQASPVIELDTYAIDAQGRRVALKVIGLDALVAGPLAPALLPHPAAGAERYAVLDPGAVFLNAQARQRLAGGAVHRPVADSETHRPLAGGETRPQRAGGELHQLPADGTVRVQTPTGVATLRVQGSVAAPGAALAVMDIAGAQATFG
ncbi:MAG: hypothetical protein KGI87_10340, partial [Burkholderiales bacterium]|nr:hypothetical protein [Burkholderiales bacterium]